MARIEKGGSLFSWRMKGVSNGEITAGRRRRPAEFGMNFVYDEYFEDDTARALKSIKTCFKSSNSQKNQCWATPGSDPNTHDTTVN